MPKTTTTLADRVAAVASALPLASIAAALATAAKPHHAPKSVPAYDGRQAERDHPRGMGEDGELRLAPRPDSPVKRRRAAVVRYRGDKAITVNTTPAQSGVRRGTDRWERLEAIQGCSTLREALAKVTSSGKSIGMDNINGMVARGHVTIIV
jgi:hypothetical protein